MKPLLAHVYEPHRVTYPCYVQPKLNGIRALYKSGRFQSRDEQPFPEALLEHLAKPLLEVFGEGDSSPVLDGELYVHSWPLQRINGAVTPVRQEANEDTKLVEYHVFDRVDFKDSFSHRHNVLNREALFVYDSEVAPWETTPFHQLKIPQVKFVEAYPVGPKDTRWGTADELYAKFISEGYEGMMYRLGDCPYTRPKQETWVRRTDKGTEYYSPKPHLGINSHFYSDKDNRCWHLLKRKSWQDDDFPIIAFEEGEGKLKGMLGAFVCQTKEGKNFNVGSGLTDGQRQHYMENWYTVLRPEKAKVKYLCLSSDGIPLNPTILAIL